MAGNYGGHSMVAPLRRVIVKRPDSHFVVKDPQMWHYTGVPDLDIARREHDAFVDLLEAAGMEVIHHAEAQPGRADAVFVNDPALITDEGAIIFSPGKELRQGEETAMVRLLESLDIPLLARLEGAARADGGDVLWLDERTLAVGVGFRTNREGLAQIRQALDGIGGTVLPVELPYHRGPEACLHLMSLISPVNHNQAVVYPPLLPVSFLQELQARGWHLIEVPAQEFDSLGPNVLAVAPGHCILLEDNPVTRQRLEEVGCRVQTFRGSEICLKAEGGPTCLTLPVLRR